MPCQNLPPATELVASSAQPLLLDQQLLPKTIEHLYYSIPGNTFCMHMHQLCAYVHLYT